MSKRLILLALVLMLSLPVVAYAVMPHTSSYDVTTVAAGGKVKKAPAPVIFSPRQPVLNPAECPMPVSPGCGGG